MTSPENKKHTPAPWIVVDDYENYMPYSQDTPQIYIWDGDEQSHKPICDMGKMGDMNYQEELANANLIAAAPELIRDLINLNYAVDNYWNSITKPDILLKLVIKQQMISKATINKALGNTK